MNWSFVNSWSLTYCDIVRSSHWGWTEGHEIMESFLFIFSLWDCLCFLSSSLSSPITYLHTCSSWLPNLMFTTKPIKTHQYKFPDVRSPLTLIYVLTFFKRVYCAWQNSFLAYFLLPFPARRNLPTSGFLWTMSTERIPAFGICPEWEARLLGCDPLGILKINEFSKLSSCLSSKLFLYVKDFYMKYKT